MSLLGQDIPSGHICSRCNAVFGQGTSRARHLHEQDRGLPMHDGGPKKIIVFINPSKRPYVTPFRRAQTLQRLLGYIGTLPHPQIRMVATANPTKPTFRVLEELLLSGQWQLVDSSDCIIRPDDYEDLIHDGMEITVDTQPDAEQDEHEPAPMLQPMAISGGKSARRPNIGRSEPTGDLLDMQINEPIAEQHSYNQSLAPAAAAKFSPSGLFASSFEETGSTSVLERDQNSGSDVISANRVALPADFGSWSRNFKSSSMSAAAAEFKPGGELQLPTSTLPTEAPLFKLPESSVKRSMAIPIVKPPSPGLAMVAAPKPDMPMTSYGEEDVESEWEDEAGTTAGPEDAPPRRQSVSPQNKEWLEQVEKEEDTVDEEPKEIAIAETKQQSFQLSLPSEDVETASVSDTIVGSGPKYEESQTYGGASLPPSMRGTPKPSDEFIPANPQKYSAFPPGDEPQSFYNDIPRGKTGGSEPPEPLQSKEESPGRSLVETENLEGNQQEEEIEEQSHEPELAAIKSSAAEMLAVLMSGAEFRPSGDVEFRPADEDLGISGERESLPMEEQDSSETVDPAESWDTTSPDVEFQATSGGGGWGDWSTGQESIVDHSQWDDRGHVRRDSDEDNKWGGPKSKQSELVDPPAPPPAKSGWAQVASGPSPAATGAWPSLPNSTGSGPSFILATLPRRPPTPIAKKPTVPSNPVGQQMNFPPRPGSVPKNSNASPNSKQKRGAVPCKFLFFVPPPNYSIPNATNSNKISLVQSTPIRKMARLYAIHFNYDSLLSCVEDTSRNPLLELRVSKSEGGPVTTHKVQLDRRLIEFDFGTEFWVSIAYRGAQGNSKRS
ncbi:hypothetical protein TWF481_000553 [Arthrobotrys musiformis]|uniref:C2H2-type domain-containing protein n=1 Tax=Arthrobotrys musiformis TaxID=47236 RepID=A0AAV9WP17_9PEZI